MEQSLIPTVHNLLRIEVFEWCAKDMVENPLVGSTTPSTPLPFSIGFKGPQSDKTLVRCIENHSKLRAKSQPLCKNGHVVKYLYSCTFWMVHYRGSNPVPHLSKTYEWMQQTCTNGRTDEQKGRIHPKTLKDMVKSRTTPRLMLGSKLTLFNTVICLPVRFSCQKLHIWCKEVCEGLESEKAQENR